MATLGCLNKESFLRKIQKKKRLQKEWPEEEWPDVETSIIPYLIFFGMSMGLISILRGVHELRVSREPLKLILRFLRVATCVVACVVTCCITFNYFSPSWKITISGIIDVLLHQDYATFVLVWVLILILTLSAPPPKSTEEKDEIKNEKNEIKNEKDAIKKEYAEV